MLECFNYMNGYMSSIFLVSIKVRRGSNSPEIREREWVRKGGKVSRSYEV